MKELSGKSVKVVGLGASGVAAAELCLRLGARVEGIDRRPRAELDAAARALPIPVATEAEAEAQLADADLIVVSPGVSWRALDAVASRVPVIGELELGACHVSAPICAVGGTNGKSTTTELVAAMLEASGRRVFCGGNLGTPLTRAVGQPWDALVVEVSSFQLERAPTFEPRVSVLLNITDDHLDRHGTFEAYAHAKGNAFVNQTAEDTAVVPFGDAVVEAQVRRGKAQVVFFGASGDYCLAEAGVVERATGERYALDGTALVARHNRLNAAAAIAAARALGAPPEPIRRALRDYRLLPHRLAHVARIGAVSFYDDSKATNVGAAVAALDSLTEPRVVLIAGGKGKDGSYAPLAEALSRRGRAVVLIGEAAAVMQQALAPVLAVERADTLDAAVARAHALAEPGDAVLLAPACASFDMFKSYADRGERFSAAVKALAARVEGG